MNFLFARRLSPDFLQGLNIYKLFESYAKIRCVFFYIALDRV